MSRNEWPDAGPTTYVPTYLLRTTCKASIAYRAVLLCTDRPRPRAAGPGIFCIELNRASIRPPAWGSRDYTISAAAAAAAVTATGPDVVLFVLRRGIQKDIVRWRKPNSVSGIEYPEKKGQIGQ